MKIESMVDEHLYNAISKMEVWKCLPNDVVRQVLSDPQIPCTTKVDLQKDIGCLVNKLVVPPQLKERLDRIYQKRILKKPTSMLTDVFDISSDDGKVRLTVMHENCMNQCSYTFRYKKRTTTVAITRDSFLGDNYWQMSSTRV